MTDKRVAADRGAAAPPAEAAAPPPPASPIEQLSPRERDILRGIACDASHKEIARDLGMAETTVTIHVQHVLRKLGLGLRVQAAVRATARGQG
jgi:two-component system nitrate/nitrite response regulator NarL